MHSQRHVILRQSLELSIARKDDAWPLQERVSALVRRLEAVIERRCDELSSPDRLHRISRLELDLGHLDSGCLEEELIEKFDQALRRELSEQVRQQESAAVSAKTASQLELFAQFVRQGGLPWWANPAQTGQPQASLDGLLREAPEILSRLLPELVADPHALRRLSVHFDDRQLAELTVRLAPAFADFPRQLFFALLSVPTCLPNLDAVPPARFRSHVWQSILGSLGVSMPYLANRLDFVRDVLVRLCRLQSLPYPSLLRGLIQASAAGSQGVVEDVAMALAESGLITGTELAKPSVDSADEAGSSARWGGAAGEAALAALYQWSEQGSEATIPAWLQSWPEPLRLALFARLGELGAGLPAALTELRGWLEQGAQGGMPTWLQSWPMLLREEFSAQLWELGKRPEPAPNPALKIRHERLDSPSPPAEQAHWDRVMEQAEFGEAESIYLENAGLVILWPFLQSFFGRLGLLEENRFRDEAAQQRAVALLQCLANGDTAVPEYLLPLNKLLCGMPIEAVFELEQPLTEEEVAEGEGLLEAVIAQAPILNKMSVAGFRGSFLLRAGLLQVRDGGWLLRVERETYDLVLDRFPWGFSWVKLPWMEAPLQVEW